MRLTSLRQKLTVAFAIAAAMVLSPARAAGDDVEGLRVEPPKAIHVRELVNQDGRIVKFPAPGRWQLAIFGFTSCPDICPVTLQKAAVVLKRLGADAAGLDVVFLSVDSDHDRPEVIRKFVTTHDARIQGLTGEAGAVQAVANEFGVIARRYQGKTALSYRIEHSSFLYLLDPQGRIVVFYPEKVGADQVVSDVRKFWSAAMSNPQ